MWNSEFSVLEATCALRGQPDLSVSGMSIVPIVGSWQQIGQDVKNTPFKTSKTDDHLSSFLKPLLSSQNGLNVKSAIALWNKSLTFNILVYLFVCLFIVFVCLKKGRTMQLMLILECTLHPILYSNSWSSCLSQQSTEIIDEQQHD